MPAAQESRLRAEILQILPQTADFIVVTFHIVVELASVQEASAFWRDGGCDVRRCEVAGIPPSCI
jgi:hypothetical protein